MRDMNNGEDNNEGIKHLKVTLLHTPEGRLLLVGVGIAFAYTLWLGVKLLVSPEESQLIIGMTATNVLFGRAAGMAFGYSMGFGHAIVIPVCIFTESIMVLIFYPLFVFSWNHLLVIRQLKTIFDKTRQTAETHKPRIRKYGIAGLFVFVWFPFWMTGPMVGCVIGFLLGLRLWVNMTVVLAGTYAAIFGWAVFLRSFHDRVASYSSYAAAVLMVLLVVILIVGHFLNKTLQEKRR
jgi:uncharacterized membrane protein